MTIYGERPVITRIPAQRFLGKLLPARRLALTYTKIILNGREISIALDDASGSSKRLTRVNVRVFEGKRDITDSLIPPDGSWMDGPELLALMKKVEALPPCAEREEPEA